MLALRAQHSATLPHRQQRSPLYAAAIRTSISRSSRCSAAAADTAGGSSSSGADKVIILYSKANCPLCEGTRDRVQGLIDRAQFMPSALTEWSLEVRDIATNPAWQAAYDMEVPVLTALAADGSEVRIPRPPPRLTTDRLRMHIEAALPQ